jgi:hypothetical protein
MRRIVEPGEKTDGQRRGRTRRGDTEEMEETVQPQRSRETETRREDIGGIWIAVRLDFEDLDLEDLDLEDLDL